MYPARFRSVDGTVGICYKRFLTSCQGGWVDDFFLKLSIMLVPGLLAITGHEVAHGYVAYRCGDTTARDLGRLTLNPLRHIDFLGLLMLFLIGIGWAKPVPVDFSRLRSPRSHGILVALSGPVANLLVASVSALVLHATVSTGAGDAAPEVTVPLILMLAFSVYINLLLALFNMIPIPPLDGGKVLAGILPPPLSFYVGELERFGLIIVMLIFIFSPSFVSMIISPPLAGGMAILLGPELTAHIKGIPVAGRLGIFPF